MTTQAQTVYVKGCSIVERYRPERGPLQSVATTIISVRHNARGEPEVLTDTGRYFDGLTGAALDKETGCARYIMLSKYAGKGHNRG